MSFTTYANINRNTPQTESLIGGTPQVSNSAGGFVQQVDIWTQLLRFLILGTTDGTYYVGQRELTKDNALNLIACIETDGLRTVKTIVEVSDGGRAPKNDPAIFALAVAAAAKDVATRQAALAALPKVCRIPTHLFHFNAYVEQFRGRGKTLNRAVRNWYQDQSVDQLAYVLVKYQQRDGWSHRDILRLVKPVPTSDGEKALYGWVVGKPYNADVTPNIVLAFERAKEYGEADNVRGIIDLIETYNLSREMIPTKFLSNPKVQEALLVKMPPHALLRNLGNLAKSGLLSPLSNAERLVITKLNDHAALIKKRVHPVDALIALRVYGGGRSIKGDGVWKPTQPVVDAVEAAFYGCFGSITPTGKRFLFGVDVSGSMTCRIAGLPISSAEAAAVMAMVSARTEQQYLIHGFTSGSSGYGYGRRGSRDGLDGFVDLGITARDRLADACAKVQKQNFGSTDCSLPILFATKNNLNVDVFVTISDNETYAGSVHPRIALKDYRQRTGIPAKNVIIATTPTKFSVNDPADPLGLDCVGFDTATPQAISEFVRL